MTAPCQLCDRPHDETVHWRNAWHIERELNRALTDRLELAQEQTRIRDAETIRAGGFTRHVIESFDQHTKSALALFTPLDTGAKA